MQTWSQECPKGSFERIRYLPNESLGDHGDPKRKLTELGDSRARGGILGRGFQGKNDFGTRRPQRIGQGIGGPPKWKPGDPKV